VLGWGSTVKYLLEIGADVNAQTQSGRTVLMFAVQFGHMSLVQLLVNRKDVILDASDLEGFTALLVAVELGDEGNVHFCSTLFYLWLLF
jgi:ankyrin repeat protein